MHERPGATLHHRLLKEICAVMCPLFAECLKEGWEASDRDFLVTKDPVQLAIESPAKTRDLL